MVIGHEMLSMGRERQEGDANVIGVLFLRMVKMKGPFCSRIARWIVSILLSKNQQFCIFLIQVSDSTSSEEKKMFLATTWHVAPSFSSSALLCSSGPLHNMTLCHQSILSTGSTTCSCLCPTPATSWFLPMVSSILIHRLCQYFAICGSTLFSFCYERCSHFEITPCIVSGAFYWKNSKGQPGTSRSQQRAEVRICQPLKFIAVRILGVLRCSKSYILLSFFSLINRDYSSDSCKTFQIACKIQSAPSAEILLL